MGFQWRSVVAAWGAMMTGISVPAAVSTELMVGIQPCDGVGLFVKRIDLTAPMTIAGAEFRNNDSRITYPEVLLFRGVGGVLGEGNVVARVSNVSETTERPGWVRAHFSEPVRISAPDEVWVGVRFPVGPGKQGLGNGPGVGAVDVPAPSGSFIAAGDGQLIPVSAELMIGLVLAGGEKATAGEEDVAREVRETYLRTGAPNPTVTALTIEFGVERASWVRLRLYDVSGRIVRSLVDDTLSAGVHQRRWDGRDDHGREVASGVYVAKLEAGPKTITQKIVMAR